MPALSLLLALVAGATVLGLLWRARQGRTAPVRADAPLTPADVGSPVSFGALGTLLQFSTDHCARCPGTHALLTRLAESRPGVAHVDIDITHRRDLANRFGIMQTPTTLILDETGRVRARIGGAPNRAGILEHLDDLTGSAHVRLAR
ncbi:thioredoxin [Cryobacterium sp. TMT1-21]|uniref:Thioredoxin n=1 Tax=Cryobacterium shii TaxID=1259235 RepID=A0AAQ2C582_9MICO|nr:thioredoxin [Cryobacterium shii]TFC80668.1 thioredoxin [Cryobacterium sp. TmT2-59]TFD14053.1 thioredoxin [Cryobacterium sp. TMT1-21]TFD17147.1 thioredoxin [Cryobacterium sp. TMT4-10]TFD23237.1 thioredoxin [Cryobacterium sp. TMT2-23]TFD40276.1 thioredoxin [Cryobacterium sp. TMT2-10]